MKANDFVEGLTNAEARAALLTLLEAIHLGCPKALAAAVAEIERQAYGEPA